MSKYDEAKFFNQNATIYGKEYSIEMVDEIKRRLELVSKEQFRNTELSYKFNFIKKIRVEAYWI